MRSAFIAKREEAVGTAEDPAARDLASLTSAEIQQQAMTARPQIQRLIDQAVKANGKYRAERFRHARERVTTDYLQAINAIRGATYRSDLETLQKTLQRRLQEGYALTPNPTRDQLWRRLLAEFEICTDALSQNALWRYQDRLADLEAIANGNEPVSGGIQWP